MGQFYKEVSKFGYFRMWKKVRLKLKLLRNWLWKWTQEFVKNFGKIWATIKIMLPLNKWFLKSNINILFTILMDGWNNKIKNLPTNVKSWVDGWGWMVGWVGLKVSSRIAYSKNVKAVFHRWIFSHSLQITYINLITLGPRLKCFII